MGASFVGWQLIGPKKLHPVRVKRAAAYVTALAAWLRRYRDAKDVAANTDEGGTPAEQDAALAALDELYHEAEKASFADVLREESFAYDRALLDRACAADSVGFLDELLSFWDSPDEECAYRDLSSSVKKNWICVTVGNVTWGDTPDTDSYKLVELGFAMGIMSILGID